MFKNDLVNLLPSVSSELKKHKATKSLYEFIKQSWIVPSVNKGQPFKEAPHLKIICDAIQSKLEQLHRGESPNDLIINVPPGTMKSIMVSKCLVPWVWTWWPEFCYLIVSYSAPLAAGHCLTAKDVISSQWYQKNWGGNFGLKKDTESYLINTKGGHCYSAGIDGTITGNHYHAHSYDDLINPEMAASEPKRLTVLRVMDTTLSNRFLNLNSCLKILTQQRIHEIDPTGHVLSRSPDGWDRFCLPATDEFPIYPPELSDLYVNVEGQLCKYLWPERLGESALKKVRPPSMTTAGFNAQYGQSPSSQEGEIIKKHFWNYFDPDQLEYDIDDVAFYADTAFGKEGKKSNSMGKSDFNVVLAVVEVKGNLYLINRLKDRLQSPHWRPELAKFVHQNGSLEYSLVYIEPKANGQANIDELRINGVEFGGQNIKLNLPTMNIKESLLTESKEVRLDSQLSKLEGRRVFLPIGAHEYTFKDQNGEDKTVKVADWVADFIEMCGKFPKGAHDDDIDPLVYALMYSLRYTDDMDELWNA